MKKMKTRISLEKKDVKKLQEGIAFLMEKLECAEYSLGVRLTSEDSSSKTELYQQVYNYQAEFQDWLIEIRGGC